MYLCVPLSLSIYLYVCTVIPQSLSILRELFPETHSGYPNPWMLRSHSQLSVSAVPQPWVHSHNSASTDSTPDRIVLCVFIGKKNLCVSGPAQFKPVLFKGQVYIYAYIWKL